MRSSGIEEQWSDWHFIWQQRWFRLFPSPFSCASKFVSLHCAVIYFCSYFLIQITALPCRWPCQHNLGNGSARANMKGEEEGTPSASVVADKCLETPIQSGFFFLEFLGWREVESSPRLRMVWVGKLCMPHRSFYTDSSVYPVSAPLASYPGSSSKLLGWMHLLLSENQKAFSASALSV